MWKKINEAAWRNTFGKHQSNIETILDWVNARHYRDFSFLSLNKFHNVYNNVKTNFITTKMTYCDKYNITFTKDRHWYHFYYIPITIYNFNSCDFCCGFRLIVIFMDDIFDNDATYIYNKFYIYFHNLLRWQIINIVTSLLLESSLISPLLYTNYNLLSQ